MRLGHCLNLFKPNLEIFILQMAEKRASSSASQLKAPVGWGSGHGTTRDGSQVGDHQTRVQIRAQANPQPEVENGGQHRVAAPD
ncbi:hypothetical protein HAX54_040264 [Datura stramonium]|uniref:Uncharacterized protein n=1 Tax=Datura stramonium TaxID=4076 RepID=A0ABS8SJZ4_DATST|nr:hypothetical protein [Datura stramonium]